MSSRSFTSLRSSKFSVKLKPLGLCSLIIARYLLDATSGPFLVSQQALYDTALACVAYLKSSLDLVDIRLPESQHVKNIVLGFHGLHKYAYAYWLEHLFRCAENCRGLSYAGDQRLEHLATRLCARHAELSTVLGRPPLTAPCQTTFDTRSRVFTQCEPLRVLALEIWEAQRRLSERQREHGLRECNPILENRSPSNTQCISS